MDTPHGLQMSDNASERIMHIKKHLRPNTLRLTAQQFEDLVENYTNLELERVSWLKHPVYEVKSGTPGKTFLHENGLCFSQSLSSMLPVLILNPQPGKKLFDCCAAPGAKTTLAAELMQNTGGILAVEKDSKRIPALVANLKRMGIINTCVWHKDARLIEPHEVFDYAIVDPPCTALGTGKKLAMLKPGLCNGINLPINNTFKVEPLLKKQKKLLKKAWECLKPGGILVYSTCTLTIEENENNIKWLLETTDAMEEKIKAEDYPGAIKGQDGIGIRLDPYQIRSEGFFIAKIKKPG